ncbi:hypothetical protein FIBSPDRAFT_870408 [Athelia psychrophila]|uniref:SnoaL-like domain-containing protein n=1 Tax=Athelia psychrophila TaxID=1759441 RepID=A0A166B367_9AGAM|nr:hypothetical protein FIBSPDRAFT_870408 [Fibularhizoctonia sp. CBS 109695]
MSTLKPLTPSEFETWLNGAFIGPPADARAFCERTMSPNYLRLQAGGGRTDFEKAVEKVTLFRTICTKWVAPVDFLVQEGNKIAARLTCAMVLGDAPEAKMELMFMAERDEQGRFERVWELSMTVVKDE